MRKRALLSGCVTFLLVSMLAALPASAARPPASPGPRDRVLVYTGDTGSPRSDAAQIERAGLQALRRLAREQGFTLTVAQERDFTARTLGETEAVVFLNTQGDNLSSAQRSAFESYYRGGGGLVAIAGAIEAESDWAFLTDVLGTRATGASSVQEALVKVADRVHPAGADLPEYWEVTGPWYDFADNVRGEQHVLATVDENTYSGGDMGFDHPIVWCGDVEGGRSFYTGAGGTAAAYGDDDFLSHLAGALEWAMGGEGDCGATVVDNFEMDVIAENTVSNNAPGFDENPLGEPIGFDVFPDGRVITTTRTGNGSPRSNLGAVRLFDPDTGEHHTIAEIPVYDASEDGLYGPAIDNNFSSNRWVYLYYAPVEMEGISQSGVPYPETTPSQNAPNTGPDPSTWDPWLGYFQLSRFRFVDGPEPHLDMASEQKIMKVEVNRGACCHVAGDIDFDSDNNLWLVTGDDTPAGGGNAGGFGVFNDMLTNETQQVNVAGATGGTFTLTFDGQTTVPIPYPLDNAAIEAALEALPNIDDVAVSGNNANFRNVQFRGDLAETDVAQMTGDGSGLEGTDTVTVTTSQEGAWYNAPHVDARRSSLNTNDLRGKVLRISVNPDGSYDIPEGNLFGEDDDPLTRPEIYAMGFRNPFRITLDADDVAYVTDYSPDSRTPQVFRGPAGTGRVEIVDEPANYGWPVCYAPNLPYFKWDFNASQPLDPDNPEMFDCAGGPENTSRWNTGRTQVPPVKQPDIWYSYNDNNPSNPLGTPCLAYYAQDPPGTCPQLFPELGSGGVGPQGAAPYDFDPANDNPTKFPEYFDGAFFLGEFTRDWMREVRLDEDGNIFKINETLPCGANPSPFLCDNPMDMQFTDGNLYLLTYGDGFFRANGDAKLVRFLYHGND